MISATFTGGIINGFQEVLSSVVVLAAFIPMLMDTGGNCGSQSSTLVIRGLALGEIRPRDALRVLNKELAVSCCAARRWPRSTSAASCSLSRRRARRWPWR